MPTRDQARPRLGLRRVIAILLAAAMGLAAVCLVVFGTTQKQLQVGVLLGLWGGLTAAFLAFGARRGQQEQGERLAEAESRASQLHEAQVRISELQRAQLEAAAQQAQLSQQVELRRGGEVELSREVAARREADYQLELSLRREIEQLMSEHIGALRTEVAALRAEVVDKLGGQLRLERIETTRVIGSDLEALQHEIRRLASNQQDDPAPIRSARPSPDSPRPPVDSTPAGTARWPVEQPADIVDAEVVEAGHASHDEVKPAVHRSEDQHDASRSSPVWSAPTVLSGDSTVTFDRAGFDRAGFDSGPAVPFEPPVTFGPTSFGGSNSDQPPVPVERPVPAEPVPVEPVERAVPAEPVPVEPDRRGPFSSSPDPFAGLPRLSPLPPDIDLIQDTAPATAGGNPADSRPPVGRRRAPEDDEDDERYHGRRRAPDGNLAGLPER